MCCFVGADGLQSSLINTHADETATACRNCNASIAIDWRYCARCGQKTSTPRLTMHEILHESVHALLHVDRSILSLIRALVIRPGGVALDYVSGRRKRYYGPFAFLVICVAIGSATIALTGFAAVTSESPNALAEFLQRHVNLIFFLQVPMIAAACLLLTPRGPFNYAEYLVLCAYTTGMHTLFYAVVDAGGWYVLRPSAEVARVAYFFLIPVWPSYFGWACSQFVPGSKWLAAAKGIIAWLIAFALMQATVFAIGNASQIFSRH